MTVQRLQLDALSSVALMLLLASEPSSALALSLDPPIAKHCLVQVIGQSPLGELTTGPPECYSAQAEVAARVAAITEGSRSVASTSSFLLATHYDGSNQQGASFSVIGSSCTGGYLNLDAKWNNRISSTANGCPRIRHYEYPSLQGSWADTLAPGGNLPVWIDNQTSSIQYLGD
jgi:hypothetical protein